MPQLWNGMRSTTGLTMTLKRCRYFRRARFLNGNGAIGGELEVYALGSNHFTCGVAIFRVLPHSIWYLERALMIMARTYVRYLFGLQ